MASDARVFVDACRSAGAVVTESFSEMWDAACILTSLPPPDLTEPWQDVVSLAGEAVACGIYGWIAPSAAAPLLRRAHGRGPVLVCPGIRLPEQAKQDQVAVGTPEDAVRGGADWIVVGRPITRADDPPGAARDIARRLV